MVDPVLPVLLSYVYCRLDVPVPAALLPAVLAALLPPVIADAAPPDVPALYVSPAARTN